MMRFLKGCFITLILLAIVACGQSRRGITSSEATRTAISTEGPLVPQQSATRKPSPSFSPSDALVITPSRTSTYPEGVNPLTGLEVASPENLERRPLLIKVANSPRDVRPQHGLSTADLVFEYYTDDGTTCFSALFYGFNAEWVGPISSAQFIDLELARMYSASLAFGSATYEVWERINQSEVTERMVSEYPAGCPPMCRTHPTDLNSLYTSTEDLQAYVERLGADEAQLLWGMMFERQVPEWGESADVLDIRYSLETFTQWTYDSDSGMYLRSQETGANQEEVEPLVDELSGRHVNTANVIVVFVPHENYLADPEMLEIRLIGRGPALVLRDQRAYLITWERIDFYNGLTFKTEDGQPFPLKPGSSWIEIVGSTSSIERPTDGHWLVRFNIP
ncbi:MAG: DUF3048 C-terminal domain-containing protein [Anaerolineaceae bacterium]|nr:MAG: DUF3048 C-terminal domain-containing protein [Anaerolineaceae bacterium]